MTHRTPSSRIQNFMFSWPLSLAMTAGALAQDQPPPASVPETQPADDGMPDLKKIMADVESIRGLEFLKDVPAEKQSLEDWETYVRAEIDRIFPPERREGMQQGLVRLGMLRQPIDIADELTSALLSQAGAYYDPESGKFYYLMADLPRMMLDVIASHELVHAMQDQHFDLKELIADLERDFTEGARNDDRMLAVRMLVEGEATYVMMAWQMKHQFGADVLADPHSEYGMFRGLADMDMDRAVAMARAMMPAGDENDALARSIREMDRIPPYILHPLYAAYYRGAFFTMMLRRQGGWEGVKDAYEDLPSSSEQTLHPEKYRRERDDPTPVAFPDFDPLKASDWTEIDAAIHGEFYLKLLLRNFDVAESVATEAAEGWDGDLYRAWRDGAGRVLVVFATTWDREEDAGEFFNAYKSALAVKYPNLRPISEAPEKGWFVYDCGETTLGRGRLVRRGREVFAVEGGTDALGVALLTGLLDMTIEHVD